MIINDNVPGSSINSHHGPDASDEESVVNSDTDSAALSRQSAIGENALTYRYIRCISVVGHSFQNIHGVYMIFFLWRNLKLH